MASLYRDDDPSVGLSLQDTIECAGHHSVGARNVSQAFQLFARG